ncbi:PREDICTED: ribonuclease H2 subunit C [Ceratosolen solmsi marchali]|uniref:Ribonuclease H2 subunit C n=1 Tax=Ceratosolen solmsi marchali TaxID=326594 RepID=A0AAJ6YBJ8_9HYME|nr:PREDICTED: ribonuclease H2 subunit C [Ceratosolen solmsi marchali]
MGKSGWGMGKGQTRSQNCRIAPPEFEWRACESVVHDVGVGKIFNEDGENLSETKNPVLHSMPCKIYADDNANVNTYFKSYIKNIDDENFKSSFRGYPLQGKKISVPKGYMGVTFFEYKKPETDETERNIYATGTFTEFTYWNYDKIPSKNDALISALDWVDIAEALHSTENETTSS